MRLLLLLCIGLLPGGDLLPSLSSQSLSSGARQTLARGGPENPARLSHFLFLNGLN